MKNKQYVGFTPQPKGCGFSPTKLMTVGIRSSTGNVLPTFPIHKVINLPDADAEFLIKNGLALMLVDQSLTKEELEATEKANYETEMRVADNSETRRLEKIKEQEELDARVEESFAGASEE